MGVRFDVKKLSLLCSASTLIVFFIAFYVLKIDSTSNPHFSWNLQLETENIIQRPQPHTAHSESVESPVSSKVPTSVITVLTTVANDQGIETQKSSGDSVAPSDIQELPTDEASISSIHVPTYRIENQPYYVQDAVRHFKDKPLDEPGVGEYNYALEEFDNSFELYREQE